MTKSWNKDKTKKTDKRIAKQGTTLSKQWDNNEFRDNHSGEKANRWTGGKGGYWRGKILDRDDGTCQICGLQEREIMDIDHIVPNCIEPIKESEIGQNLDKFQTICPNCHRRKTIKENRELKITWINRKDKSF